MPERNPLTVRMDACVNYKNRQEGKNADTFGVMAAYLKERETFRGFSLKHSGGIPILNARTRFQEESGLQEPTGANSSTGQMHQI